MHSDIYAVVLLCTVKYWVTGAQRRRNGKAVAVIALPTTPEFCGIILRYNHQLSFSASFWHYLAKINIFFFIFPDAGSFRSVDGFSIDPPLCHGQALNTICDHVDDIESVLRTELEFGQKTAAGAIKRDAMARKLARARGKEVRGGDRLLYCLPFVIRTLTTQSHL